MQIRKYALLITLFQSVVFSSEKNPPDQKILFVSIPKSGTHLLKKAISRITHNLPIRWIGLSKVEQFNPINDLRLPGRITSAHLFPEIDIVRTEYPSSYKKILMIRDPRDIMVSFMNHLMNEMTWSRRTKFDFKKFDTLSMDEKLRETFLFPNEFLNPQICFKYAVKWMQDPSVFVCRFEDLVGEEGGGSAEKQRAVLRDLAAFLDFPLSNEEVDSIAEKLFGGTWTFRKGKIGLWKEYYSEENKRLFKKLMGQAVIDLGYEKDDSW